MWYTKISLRILMFTFLCVLLYTIPRLNEHVIKVKENIYYFNTGDYVKVENHELLTEEPIWNKFNTTGGLVDSGTFINGRFYGQYGDFKTNWTLLASLVFILTAIYSLFFISGDIRYLKDLINKRRQKAFSSLPTKHQQYIIKKNIN